MATKIQMRRGTTSEWNSADPILSEGEIGYNSTLSSFKIGDGEAAWSELDYYQTSSAITPNEIGAIASTEKNAADGVAILDASQNVLTKTGIVFEGSTADEFETSLVVVDPTADRTITLPNITGTVITTGDSGTVTSTMIADGAIVNADINASAAIAVSKLAASTISGVTLGNNLNALTIGTGLSGTSYNGSSAVTVAIDSTVATLTGTQTLTNKTINGANNTLTVRIANDVSGLGTNVATFLATPSSANLISAVTDETGSGALVFATSPTLVTPVLGVATGTSFNSITGLSSTNPAALGAVAVGVGTTTARADHVHPTTGLGLTASGLNQFASTTSSQLAGVISDETGSGALVFGTSPTIATPVLTLSTTTSTTEGRIAWDSTNDKIIIGDGTTAREFASSTLFTNAQTGTTYTFVLADKDKMVELSNASAITASVPTNSSVAYPVGTQINIIQTGAGQVTIAAVTPGTTTINATPGLKLRAQWSSATLIKRATDTWVAIGDLSE
jgi:hypothetical protein